MARERVLVVLDIEYDTTEYDESSVERSVEKAIETNTDLGVVDSWITYEILDKK